MGRIEIEHHNCDRAHIYEQISKDTKKAITEPIRASCRLKKSTVSSVREQSLKRNPREARASYRPGGHEPQGGRTT